MLSNSSLGSDKNLDTHWIEASLGLRTSLRHHQHPREVAGHWEQNGLRSSAAQLRTGRGQSPLLWEWRAWAQSACPRSGLSPRRTCTQGQAWREGLGAVMEVKKRQDLEAAAGLGSQDPRGGRGKRRNGGRVRENSTQRAWREAVLTAQSSVPTSVTVASQRGAGTRAEAEGPPVLST